MGQFFSSQSSNKTVESTLYGTQATQVDYDAVSTRFSIHSNEELQQGIEHLNEYGYVVFSDVLSNDEVTHSVDLLWKHLETLKEPFHIRRNDPETWNRPWPGASYIGLLNDMGMGQSEFMWSVRGNPNIKKVFSQIWNSNELLVSFDGAGCFRNWHFNPQWRTLDTWYHCDQNPFRKPNRCSIQGLVSLMDSDESTGGFVVVPDSHKHFTELQSITQESRIRGDFIEIPDGCQLFQKLRPRLVKCKAGDLVLWDSRCIHCNVPANIDRENITPPELLRIVAYVCMIPMSMFVPDMDKYKNLEEFRCLREKFVQNRITSTHWPLALYGSREEEGLYFEKTPLKLNAFQYSLIVGTNVEADNKTTEFLM